MDYARSFAHNDTIMDFIRQPKVLLRLVTTVSKMVYSVTHSYINMNMPPDMTTEPISK